MEQQDSQNNTKSNILTHWETFHYHILQENRTCYFFSATNIIRLMLITSTGGILLCVMLAAKEFPKALSCGVETSFFYTLRFFLLAFIFAALLQIVDYFVVLRQHKTYQKEASQAINQHGYNDYALSIAYKNWGNISSQLEKIMFWLIMGLGILSGIFSLLGIWCGVDLLEKLF